MLQKNGYLKIENCGVMTAHGMSHFTSNTPHSPLVLTKPDWAILVTALVFPSLLTWLYFVLLADTPGWVQQLVYGFGKTLQFGLPLYWIAVVRHEPWFPRRFCLKNNLEGIGFGVLVCLLMIALYLFVLRLPDAVLSVGSPARVAILDKIEGMGLNFCTLALVGVFYSIVHSGLEEYYWRWFVLGELRRSVPWFVAALVSSLGFMAHHVLLLGTYFGYDSVYCWLGSLGVAVGGFYWSWLYVRSNSIWGSWIGHGFIDAAIFCIGLLILCDFHFP